MIVNRDDYVTKEEYQEKLAIYNDIQRIINEIKDVNNYMTKHRHNWREMTCFVYKINEDMKFQIEGDYRDIVYINKGIMDMFGVERAMNSIGKQSMYRYDMYNDMMKLYKMSKIYPDLVRFLDKYKDKTISIQQFDNKEKFKDIYDTIKNLEEKYENTRKN